MITKVLSYQLMAELIPVFKQFDILTNTSPQDLEKSDIKIRLLDTRERIDRCFGILETEQ